jgi:hypothetical protein
MTLRLVPLTVTRMTKLLFLLLLLPLLRRLLLFPLLMLPVLVEARCTARVRSIPLAPVLLLLPLPLLLLSGCLAA